MWAYDRTMGWRGAPFLTRAAEQMMSRSLQEFKPHAISTAVSALARANVALPDFMQVSNFGVIGIYRTPLHLETLHLLQTGAYMAHKQLT